MPVKLSALTARKILEFDLYQEMGKKPRLYKSKNFPLLSIDIRSLEHRGYDTLYVPVLQKLELIRSMSQGLPKVLNDESIPISTKLAMLNQISESILSDVMKDPTSQAAISLAVGQCEHHISFAMFGGDAQKSMLTQKHEASFPVAHAMTVSNLSILLGLKCGIESAKELHALGVGALLHEIGKTVIDKDYYLRPKNRLQMKNNRLNKYPEIGIDLLKEMNCVPIDSLAAIAEHQERLDGSGYPQNLKEINISLAGRIVAICDTYDEALHSPLFNAKPTPFKVLMKMRGEQNKFDEKVLISFIQMLGAGLSN
ncbi:MAG: HD domain-containing protein [candidate division Zixibacteria bacterium]|nr:HD domain-containing protein [candidate division Zixibacteria bacterium]